MSSAILYLAIVAIWACVLIPRWLRRDSAHGVAAAFSDTMAPGASVPDAPAATPAAPGRADDADERGTDLISPSESGDAPIPVSAPPPAPLDAEQSRRRMLAARRRLLGLLIILEAAAVALAFIGLAAMWVVVPPSIMLAGYLLLLREAGRADAEHAQRAAEAAARARATARSRHGGQARAGQRPTPFEGSPLQGTAAAAASATSATSAASAASAAALAAKLAAAPVPADYEDSGRDFAPGLAGKYTPSYADSDLTDEDRYGYGYEEPRFRRAVGD